MATRKVLRKLKYVDPVTGSCAYTKLWDIARVGKTREQWKRQKKKWNRHGIDPLRPINWVAPAPVPMPEPAPAPAPVVPPEPAEPGHVTEGGRE